MGQVPGYTGSGWQDSRRLSVTYCTLVEPDVRISRIRLS